MKGLRAIGRGACALLLLLPALGCQDEGLAGPHCEGVPGTPVGTWSHLDLPPGVLLPGGDAVATDGEQLIAFDLGCTECSYYTLDTSPAAWRESGIVEFEEQVSSGIALAVSEYYFLAVVSKSTGAKGYVEYAGHQVLFDRDASAWSLVTIPDNLRSLSTIHWTGSEILFWSGKKYETENPAGVVYPDTPAVQYYDGALLDPSSGEWREIPPAREDANYLWGDGGPSLTSVWTPGGLFVWGTNPEQTERWGAIFDVESMSWEILDIGGDAPPLLRNHRMLSLGSDVYVFAGVTPGNDSVWRRLWRYSVVDRRWEEIDVPTWADPLLGAVVNGRLAFTGRCQGGDLYDPATDTWKPLSAEGEPPSSGIPRGAGSFLTVTDTYYGEQETNQVWLLDLRDELGE